MSTAVNEYGKALYDLSREEKIESEILGDVRSLYPVFENEQSFIAILSVPSIPKSERLALVDKVFSGKVHPYLLSFFKLLIKRNRAGIILPAMREYERLWYENSGIVKAEVVTAVPLDEKQKSRILRALEKKTGRDVEMHTVIDTSIIGGVSIRIDGKIIEDTVKKRLDGVKNKLKQTTL